MSLRRIFDTLYAEAEAAGEARRNLAQGAGVAVRVQGARRQVILSRQGAPVGIVELVTFQRDGQIPDAAEGVCWLPTARGLYRVSYTWEIAATPPSLFAPALHPICTLGYGAGWSPSLVAAEVARLGAQLWDIRYQPWSRTEAWRGPALAELIGPAYVAVKALGNRNYKAGPITLANPAAAVERARVALGRQPIVLLCGCKDAAICHRSVAADYLADALGGAEIVHLAPPAPTRVEGYYLPEVADLPEHL